MLVKEVMTSPAITAPARTTVKEGLRLLDKHGVTSLPVTDNEGRIVGIISEADLLLDALRHDARTRMIPDDSVDDHPNCVGDVMSMLTMTVTGDTDLADAVELMTATAVKSLPVVELGHVVGMISRSDVVHLLARSDEHIRGEIDELLRSAGFECDVDVDGGVVNIADLEDPAQWRVAEVLAGSVPGVITVYVSNKPIARQSSRR